MRRTEAEAVRKLHPSASSEDDVEISDYLVQLGAVTSATLTYRCLARSKAMNGLHLARLALMYGRCTTSQDHPLQITPRS